MTIGKRFFSILAIFLTLGSTGIAQDTVDAKQLFSDRCSSCHTIDEGKLVGPELKGVNEKRDEEWLLKFIRNSQKVIKSGDQTAVKLFNEHNQTIMPANEDLSDKEIKALLSYIEEGGADPTTTASGDTISYGPRRKEREASGSGLEGVSPNDFIFRLTFWFSTVLIVGTVFGVGYIISRIS